MNKHEVAYLKGWIVDGKFRYISKETGAVEVEPNGGTDILIGGGLNKLTDAICRFLNHEAACSLPYDENFWCGYWPLKEMLREAALNAGLEPFDEKYTYKEKP